MANIVKLNYTADEINEKLGKIDWNPEIKCLKEKYVFYYYSTLANAIASINNSTLVGDTTEQSAMVGVYNDESNVSNLVLLQDIEDSGVYVFDVDVKINLGGKTLTMTSTETNILTFNRNVCINGVIEGGSIVSKGNAINSYLIYTPSGNKCLEITGGYYEMCGNNTTMGRILYLNNDDIIIKDAHFNAVSNQGDIQVMHIMDTVLNFFVDNCVIEARLDGGGKLYGINYGGKEGTVINTRIHTVTEKKGSTSDPSGTNIGIVNGLNTLYLSNNYVFCDAPENSAKCGVSYAISTMGNYLTGAHSKTYISSGSYFGTLAAVTAAGNLYITGGKFTSCSHGGLYMAQGGDYPADFYIKDATIGNVEYSGEYNFSTMSNSYLGAFYVGGNTGNVYCNNKIYMDNCTILCGGTEYAGVLRNTKDETNNVLFISNTIIPDGHSIRIDNGNYMVAGEGMNITASTVSNINAVSYTDERYVFNPYKIVQGTGDSEITIMSQKATTEAINNAMGANGSSMTHCWTGKKAVFLGDSIVQGYLDTGNVENPYPKVVANNLGMTLTNYGIGGSTLAQQESYGGAFQTVVAFEAAEKDTSKIYQVITGQGKKTYEYDNTTSAWVNSSQNVRSPLSARWSFMSDDADLIVVHAGTNDFQYNWTPIGTMEDRTPYTFYGALHTILLGLIEKYKGKTIVFVTPLKRAQTPYTTPTSKNDYSLTLSDYRNMILEVCDYYSIPVIDVFSSSGLNPYLDSQIDLFDNYKTHPFQWGHSRLGDIISSRLLCIQQFDTAGAIDNGGSGGDDEPDEPDEPNTDEPITAIWYENKALQGGTTTLKDMSYRTTCDFVAIPESGLTITLTDDDLEMCVYTYTVNQTQSTAMSSYLQTPTHVVPYSETSSRYVRVMVRSKSNPNSALITAEQAGAGVVFTTT